MDDPDTEKCKATYLDEDLMPLLNEELLSLFHLNILSLPYKLEELNTLLNKYDLSFDMTGMIESSKGQPSKPLNVITLPGQNIEQPSTETSNKEDINLHLKRFKIPIKIWLVHLQKKALTNLTHLTIRTKKNNYGSNIQTNINGSLWFQ